MFKLEYNVTKINFYMYLINNEIYPNEKMEYLKKVLFNNKIIKFNIFFFYLNIYGLALTRKICGILSKKLQKLALLKLLSNLSVKTTVFCYFFDIPQILQV